MTITRFPTLPAAMVACALAGPAMAKTCGIQASGDFDVYGQEGALTGSVRIGETPAGLVMFGTIGGSQIDYRVQVCEETQVADMIGASGNTGPDNVYLVQYEDGSLGIEFENDDGSAGFAALTPR